MSDTIPQVFGVRIPMNYTGYGAGYRMGQENARRLIMEKVMQLQNIDESLLLEITKIIEGIK